MTTAFHLIKIILSVGFVVAGSVALWLAPGMAIPLFAGSIAWSLVPEA